MSRVVVSRDGTRISYEVAGEGPVIILVDGAFCRREFGPMRKLAAELARDLPVARAARIQAPTLVLNGTKTWPVLRDAARVTAEAIHRARHLSLEGQTHNVAAPAIAPVLRDFLKA